MVNTWSAEGSTKDTTTKLELYFHWQCAFSFSCCKSKTYQNMNQFQLVLPQCKIMDVLHHYHDSRLAGHCGIQNCLDRVKEHYYISRMAEVIADYERSRVPCQHRKRTQNHTKSAIVAYPLPWKPFRVWQLDIYGPLLLTVTGYTYILTAVDLFSKFFFHMPLASDGACTVSQRIYLLFATFGSSESHISDKGTEFTAKVTNQAEINTQICASLLGSLWTHSCYHCCQAHPVTECQTKQLG